MAEKMNDKQIKSLLRQAKIGHYSVGNGLYLRITEKANELRKIQLTGKFGGATGNFNAHILAFPNVDWIQFAEAF